MLRNYFKFFRCFFCCDQSQADFQRRKPVEILIGSGFNIEKVNLKKVKCHMMIYWHNMIYNSNLEATVAP